MLYQSGLTLLLIVLQSVKDMPVVQDGPPPGGFPSIRWGRRIPSTGPTGFTLFALGTVVMAYGFVKVSFRSAHVLHTYADR